jgi:hypothetical protein
MRTSAARVAWTVPAESRSRVALRRLSLSEETELEGFGQPNVRELGGDREGFCDVPAIEGTPEPHEGGALRGHERMFALASSLCGVPPFFSSTAERQNETSYAGCAPAYRAAPASDDDIDALLVAAIVTQSGAESSESVRDRAPALDAHIFRILPRDAHNDRSPPVCSPPSRPAGVAAATGPHFSVSSKR